MTKEKEIEAREDLAFRNGAMKIIEQLETAYRNSLPMDKSGLAIAVEIGHICLEEIENSMAKPHPVVTP